MKAAGIGNPTASMRFAWPWRPAQARVLHTLERHLADRKVHVVAPPGSGKTVLGLELFRRLGRPAVALSPTTTIQWQWVSRLQGFLEPDSDQTPDWASLELDAPGYFTSITYQALHTRFRGRRTAPGDESEAGVPAVPTRDEILAVAERFRALGVGTLILDEAHHLRQQWWKALSFLIEQLGEDVTTISLTATPPYDVLGFEWQRYEELCGPIDDEISVPELVRDGTLCAHQDYIRAVSPSPADARTAREHDAAVDGLIRDLLDDALFLAAVADHPWIRSERPDAEEILEQPELACALLIYLRARGQPLPKRLLRLLDWREADLPTLNRRWWQVLLRAYVDETAWKLAAGLEEHRRQLLHRLRRDRLLWRRELRIADSRTVRTHLALTSSKIDACATIHQLEAQARGSQLRQVVLTDFIDDEALDAPAELPRRLGACPVFLALARRSPDPKTVALLTGRLAVLHVSRVKDLERELDDGVEAEELAGLPSFVQVCRGASTRLIAPFTRLLERGNLRVLVATRSLLGEGWDAPCVNSLVLASFVGSFILSNQMRGRALRVDRSSPEKAATIWHLVAVDPATHSGDADLFDLRRRFTTFVGLAANAPRIESGYDRLDAPSVMAQGGIETMNREMSRRFAEFDTLRAKWATAIEGATTARVLPTIVTPEPKTGPLVFERTLERVLAVAAGLAAAAWTNTMSGLPQNGNLRQLLLMIAIGAGLAAAMALPNLIRYAILSWRHLPVDGSIRQIAQAVREGLVKAGVIAEECNGTSLKLRQGAPGIFSVSLSSGSFREQSLFADSLQEVLGPIQNPRYLVTRRGVWWARAKRDYHAVPHVLAQHKVRALRFQESWRKWVGPGTLIYTRTPEGRRWLLKARAAAFSQAFASRAERLDEWH